MRIEESLFRQNPPPSNSHVDARIVGCTIELQELEEEKARVQAKINWQRALVTNLWITTRPSYEPPLRHELRRFRR